MSQQGSSAQHGHAETQASKAATIPRLPITKRKREQGEAGTGPYRPTALPLTRVSFVQGGTGPHSLQGDRDTKCHDAVTNDYKRGGWQHRFISLQSRRSEPPNQYPSAKSKVSAGPCSLWGLSGGIRSLLAFFGLCLTSVCVKSPSAPLLGSYMWSHLGPSRSSPHLKTFHLMTCTKLFFPNKVTVPASRN